MQEGETFSEEVVGLYLPDGTMIFPPDEWHGRSLETPQDRNLIFQSLQKSAKNLGIPEQEFLSRYAWVTRTKHTAIFWANSGQAPVPLSHMSYPDPDTSPMDGVAPGGDQDAEVGNAPDQA